MNTKYKKCKQHEYDLHQDCAECMQIWADFLLEKNLHAVSEFKASDFDKR